MTEVVMAKSKGVGRGGRRKGAGRPRISKTGKTSYFSTRITPQTRALLEVESRDSGQSLSQTIERLLLLGLHEKLGRNRPSTIRAMCYLITALIERISVSVLKERNLTHPEYNWRSNPFMFAAFRTAVLHLFDALRPQGEIVAPPFLQDGKHSSRPAKYDDAQHFGRGVAQSLLQALNFFGANEPEELRSAIRSVASETNTDIDQMINGRSLSDVLTNMHYGMADAARDLDIECRWDLENEIDKLMTEDQTPKEPRLGTRA
jgi:hypothetical protein